APPAPTTTVSEPAPAPPPPAPTTTRRHAPKPPPLPLQMRPKHPVRKAPKAPAPGPALVLPPPTLHPPLTAGGYVFPVYGPSAYSDTFGAARADVTYHHGDDIFAPLGAPILAVADGTVFSIGW